MTGDNIYIIFGNSARSDGSNIYGIFATESVAKRDIKMWERIRPFDNFHIERFKLIND